MELRSVLIARNNKKGMLFGLVLVVFLALVFSFYQLKNSRQPAPISDVTKQPAYKTGKAFEIIEPEQPANSFSDKSPRELIGEADQIIARANATIEKHKLGELELTAAEQRAAEKRIANIERNINELVEKLEQ